MHHQLRRSNIFYRARYLRRHMTFPEKILWIQLKKRQFGNYKFRRQVPIGQYIADFLCIELQLVIEVDGDSHLTQKAYDAQRTAWLEHHGYHVIRILNEEILSESKEIYQRILDACTAITNKR